ncbi:MAG: hypothetical protein JWO62_2609 [Acidimicrobiaceae bacterium]|nr:hypothetical protein [Acidimicrobiaceae bacterium]
MSTDLSTYVARRRALLAEATARPWFSTRYGRPDYPECHGIEAWSVEFPAGVCLAKTERGHPAEDASAIVALVNDADRVLDVVEAAARVVRWMAKDRYTQVEKVDGGSALVESLDRLIREATS